MKKSILPLVASGFLFFCACTNDNSSTVAQDDEGQSSTSHSGSNEHQPANQGSTHSEGQKEPSHATTNNSHTDTSKANGSGSSANGQSRSASWDTSARKVKTNAKTHQ